jgi:hypothetical protein
VVDIAAVPWLEAKTLPNASLSQSVQVDVLEPFAVIVDGLQPSVERASEREPTLVVIVGAVPETEPSFAPTAWPAPASLLTVNVTLATPPPFVVLVAAAKAPPLVLDHVTVRPAAATALLLASTSWAEMVTVEPATGEYELELTTYLAGVPAAKATFAFPVVIAAPLRVAAIVALPTTAGAVSVAV